MNQNFIKEIKGDYDNIVGLPVKTLIKMLNEIKNFSVK
ncbi:MAG: Maf family protein [Candidatus Gastranaerophilales bacterium]|nr:Maf family protein [Candidatus Gastranaerophilales bacterium]